MAKGLRLLLTLAGALVITTADAATARKVKLTIVDSVANTPVAYATYSFLPSGGGGITDDKGKVTLSIPVRADSVEFAAMGYTPVRMATADIRSGSKIRLHNTGMLLGEVIVRPGKEKYSKKNNPAVDFVNRIRSLADLTDPRSRPLYSAKKYERITLALNHFNPESDKNLFMKRYGFLRNAVDTSEVSGSQILNFSVREKISTVHHRRDPQSEKERVVALKQSGIDDFMDQESMRVLYEDFFSDIDLYKNDIYLLHTQFVSPFSKIAPDFYKFYLTDTVPVDGEQCVELTFVPRNDQSFGFTGRVYVPLGDTTMFIKKVTMNVPNHINVNFLDQLYINQEYERGPDGVRLLKRDDLIAEISILPGTQGLYVRRNTAYDDYDFSNDQPTEIFNRLGRTSIAADAELHTDDYWDRERLLPMSVREADVSVLTETLRRDKLYYWVETFIKIMVNGYISTDKPSKFDIGPVNTLVSHNTLEGFRLRAGGMTTANLSKRFFLRGYGAYGFRDHKWKYHAEAEYSFLDKTYHSREFPIHAIRAEHTYDIDMLGQHFAFTNPDNMFLSFRRHEDLQITYLRSSRLSYILELENNFSVTADFHHNRQEATRAMTFVAGDGRAFNHYNESGFTVTLRYAPGEKFYQKKSSRTSITPHVPVIQLTHTYSPKNFIGNNFEINITELSLSKRFWLSAFGYLDAIVKGGHVWSRSPYPNLLVPNANLSYTIQPESFALLNPMEFVTDSYAMWDLSYWANGAILNYIPLLRKLKLREVFSFRGFYGHLSRRNDPLLNPSLFRFPDVVSVERLGDTPYMEAGVGLDNIFKILRVDYVWRLTYRHVPGADRGGVRVALHFTF